MSESVQKKKGRRKKAFGQSLVEFTVLLPILLMMLSGLIEFGFLLNYYLDLVDAAREAARFAADDDPLIRGGPFDGDTDDTFYNLAQKMALDSINIGSGGQITLDTANNDDIVISTFSVMNGVIDRRFPDGSPTGLSYAGNQSSKFTNAMINSKLDPGAPNAGIVLIEIYFEYHMILGLPWIKMFVSDPIMLHAYSIMPNSATEPTPTPP
jgi:hypothetical protein